VVVKQLHEDRITKPQAIYSMNKLFQDDNYASSWCNGGECSSVLVHFTSLELFLLGDVTNYIRNELINMRTKKNTLA
jgi:hypothetical protein